MSVVPLHAAIQRPGYRVYDEAFKAKSVQFKPGVWHHTFEKHGEEKVPRDTWLCGPLHVESITRCVDQSSDYGLLLRMRNLDGRWIEWALPREMLVGRQDLILSRLLSMGLEINYEHSREIVRYIAASKPCKRLIAATSTGWQSPELFVMPQQCIGVGEAYFQAEEPSAGDYRTGGTLEGWQEQVGRLCKGNPVLMLSVCGALAGPLLYHVPRHGCGFHLVGDSSTGKSSALMAAASVWGRGDDYLRTWRATGNGLEGIAAVRSDTALILDEIGEADPRQIGGIVYALANGVGKSRANRTGAARTARRWRVVVLSSGELGLATLMKVAGQSSRMGQQLRLLDILVNRRFGAWDDLHSFADGRAFSDSLKRSSLQHYGHAGPAFVRKLLESESAEKTPELMAQEIGFFTIKNGQQARAAEAFALLAVTGELAISLGVLPLSPGSARKAILELYDAWRAERGSEAGEQSLILSSIQDFLAAHGDSRFSPLKGDARDIRDRAGYWDEMPGESRLFLFNRPGLEEAARGFDISRVITALRAVDAIVKSDSGRHQATVRLQTGLSQKFYVVDPSKLES